MASFPTLSGWDVLAIVVLTGLFMGAIVAAVSLAGEWGGMAVPLVPVLYAGLALQALAIWGSVYLVATRRHGIGPRALGFRGLSWRALTRAVGIWLLCRPIIALVLELGSGLLEVEEGARQIDDLTILLETPARFVGALLLVGILMPWSEELLFRGVIYGWMRARFGVAAGAMLSAVVFSLPHLYPEVLFPVFVLGVAFALIYEWTGTLWASFAVHAAHNSLHLVWLYLSLHYGAPPPDLF